MPEQDRDSVKRLLESVRTVYNLWLRIFSYISDIQGADPETTDQSGMTLLSIAAKYNFVDAIGVLLQAGAKINAKHPPYVASDQ